MQGLAKVYGQGIRFSVIRLTPQHDESSDMVSWVRHRPDTQMGQSRPYTARHLTPPNESFVHLGSYGLACSTQLRGLWENEPVASHQAGKGIGNLRVLRKSTLNTPEALQPLNRKPLKAS